MDLSPEDNSTADGRVFTTTYTYDGASKRIASITQSDGAKLSFSYYSDARIRTVTDALGGTTSFAYDSATRRNSAFKRRSSSACETRACRSEAGAE